MLSISAKLSSHQLTVRKRVAVNMQGIAFTLARLKIVPSYHQEFVSHPMPGHIEALNYFSHTHKKSSNLSLSD